MHILGDVHGKKNELASILHSIDDDVLCVGDVGVGPKFGMGPTPKFAKNFWAIRGNHDCPEHCANHPQFIKDYGMWRDIFVIAGARSVDWKGRIEGTDWWRNEELSYAQLNEAIELYAEAKPDIVVSHDCPYEAASRMNEYQRIVSPETSKLWGIQDPYPAILAMDEMLKIHRPKHWFFGHWHMSAGFDIDGTQFRCLGILELVEIPEV